MENAKIKVKSCGVRLRRISLFFHFFTVILHFDFYTLHL